jgi:hypothetical protein
MEHDADESGTPAQFPPPQGREIIMLNTTAIDTSTARTGATEAVEEYQRHHCANQDDVFDNARGFAVLGDPHGAFERPISNEASVKAALRDISEVVADQTPSVLDRIGYNRCLPPSSMPHWHGAFVSAPLARCPHAG